MTSMIYRRRYKQVIYPASQEDWDAAGYTASLFDEDFAAGGFWAKVLANPTGHDERTELQLRAAFLAQPTEETRRDYRKELASRVPEWNLCAEDADGNVVPVPAPGEGEGNDDAFDLLPSVVAAWLTTEIQTAHRPKATTPASGQPGTLDRPSDEGLTPEA